MKAKNSSVRELSASAESILTLARQDLACYALANYPAFQLPPHVVLLISELEAVERGDVKRLIISVPPRHSKSYTASWMFPSWYLGRHPDHYIIHATYGQDLSDDFGRRIRNTVQSRVHRAIFPGSVMSDDSSAISRFNLSAGGSYFAVGRGGAMTGRGAHGMLLDDTLKDQAEAYSDAVRASLHSWYKTTARTRMMPAGWIVIVATRWHQEDLAGFVQTEFADEGWRVVNLPAIAEAGDPLGRSEGEALWPDWYPIEELERLQRGLGSTAFAALYQGRPSPEEGGIIKKHWWRFYNDDEMPPFDTEIQSWDLAFKGTKTSSNYVAGQAWGKRGANCYLKPDEVFDQLDFTQTCEAFLAFSARHPNGAKLVEDKANGPALISTLQDRIPGIVPVNADGGAEAVARAVAPYIEAGNAWLPNPYNARADDGGRVPAGSSVRPDRQWVLRLIENAATFPNGSVPPGSHGDDVVAATQALHRLLHGISDGWNAFEAMRAVYAPGGWMSKSTGTTRAATSAEPPRISTISPCECSPGDMVTVTGENLGAVTLLVDGHAVDVKESDSSSLHFVAPAHAAGPVCIAVQNDGGVSRSNPGLTYSNALPSRAALKEASAVT